MAPIRRLAATEGILLDPVYTGKAFAGLLDLVEQTRWAATSRSSSCTPAACRRCLPPSKALLAAQSCAVFSILTNAIFSAIIHLTRVSLHV